MYKKTANTKVYEENIDVVNTLANKLGVSFTSALNSIINDWELTRKTKESQRERNETK